MEKEIFKFHFRLEIIRIFIYSTVCEFSDENCLYQTNRQIPCFDCLFWFAPCVRLLDMGVVSCLLRAHHTLSNFLFLPHHATDFTQCKMYILYPKKKKKIINSTLFTKDSNHDSNSFLAFNKHPFVGWHTRSR